MPALPSNTKVEHYEAIRFWVSSSDKPSVRYLVDLESYGGSGACDCPHFACRMEPHMRRDSSKRGPAYHCKHIRQARDFLCDTVIQKFVEQSKGSARSDNSS